MKQVVGYKGDLKIIDFPEPLLGPFDIKIRVRFSAYSSGTESSRVMGQKRSAFLTKYSSYKAIAERFKALEFREILARYRKFQGYYAPLGYSCCGEIVEIGEHVNDKYNIGDFVVSGGENSVHAEYVSVPQGLVTKVEDPEANIVPQLALTYIATIPINSCCQIIKDQPSNVLILGGGLTGTIASLFLDVNNVKNVVYDPSATCLFGSTKSSNLITDLKKLDCKFDAVLVTTGAIRDFTEFYKLLNKEVMINVLGESALSAFNKGQVEELYGKITFCNSFGFGRRDAEFELLGKDPQKRLDSTFSITDNVSAAIDFLIQCNLSAYINESSVLKRKISVTTSSINLFEYGESL